MLTEHLARLEASADALDIPVRRDGILDGLEAFARTLDAVSRVRLVVSQAGSATLEATALPISSAAYRVAISGQRFCASDPWLRHKTTRRDRYEQPLSEAVAACQADEVIFMNERDELCEGARHNIFVECEGRLLTPPLSSGLLPGTLRASLLASGIAREAVLRAHHLTGSRWFLGNSVRGLVPASLIEP